MFPLQLSRNDPTDSFSQLQQHNQNVLIQADVQPKLELYEKFKVHSYDGLSSHPI